MRLIICDRCGRFITRTVYYRIKFQCGEIWDTCGNCKSSLEFANGALNDILSVEARKE